MNTIFEQKAVDGFIARIAKLQTGNSAQWGKMNVSQMVQHCSMADEGLQGKRNFPRLFVGRLFGGMVLKKMMKDEGQMGRNMPTHPLLKKFSHSDFEQDKSRWLKLLEEYRGFSTDEIMHPFFGRMSREQVGRFVFKHTDHHLRQFGV